MQITLAAIKTLHEQRRALEQQIDKLDDEIRNCYARHGHTNRDWAVTQRERLVAERSGLVQAARIMGIDIRAEHDKAIERLVDEQLAAAPGTAQASDSSIGELCDAARGVLELIQVSKLYNDLSLVDMSERIARLGRAIERAESGRP